MTTPTQLTVDMEEVHELSLDFLQMLESEGVKTGVGAVSAALSLGRLMSPKVLEPDEEIQFLQAIMEFAGMYFGDGGRPN